MAAAPPSGSPENDGFRQFFDSLDDLVLVAGMDGRILHANSTAVLHLGYGLDELVGMNLIDLHPPAFRDEASSIHEAMGRKELSECPLPIVRKDGAILEVRKNFTFGRWNSEDCIFGIIRLLSREQDLFSSGPVFTIEWSPRERWPVRAVSSNVEQILGYRPDEVQAPDFLYADLIHPDDLGPITKEVAKNIADHNDAFEQSYRLKCRSGEYRWFHDATRLVRNPQGELTAIRGYLYDQTLQKSAERDLGLFRTLVETSGDCFYLLDIDDGARMCYVNEASEVHFGASRTEICTWRLPQWDPNFTEDKLPALIERLCMERRLHFESRHRRKDGSIIPVEITANAMTTPEGRRFAYGWFADISKRLESEEALLRATNAAEAASRAKSEFLTNMSHEIRTPLNSVIGFTDLLKATPLSPAQQNYVENANASAQALLGIINDILDFSKIEAGMVALERRETDLAALLDQCADLVKYEAGKKSLELVVDTAPSLPRLVILDPVRLKQVLVNLLGNAVKFTEVGEVVLETSFTPLPDRTARFRIAVHDSGIGIPEARRESLFKPFSQADTSATRRFGGTGLGLAISDMIIGMMDGTLEVTDRPGGGSTFVLEFPAPIPDAPTPAPAPPPVFRHALVVDDNASSRRVLKRLLADLGIPSEEAECCSSGLRILSETPAIDLVLCDSAIPDTHGLDSIEKIRAIRPDLPILLMHPSSEDFHMHQTCEAGGVRFQIAKPIRATTLLAALQKIHPAPDAAPPGPEAPAPRSSLVVLVAEDVPTNLLLVKAMLGRIHPGAKVVEAANGAVALEAFSKCKPDIILMDVQMPVMDGIEATKAIRAIESGSRTPIIAITAGVLEDHRTACLAAGMDDFLTKPLKIGSLQNAIARLLTAAAAATVESA